MRKIRFVLSVLLVSILLAGVYASAASAAPEHAGKDDKGYFVSGRLLVHPRAGADEHQFKNAIAAEHAQVERKIHGMETMIVRVPAGQEQKIMERLQKNPHVEFVELDRYVEPNFIPNDPSYGSQWHHTKINSPGAWDIERGDGNMIVAIIDTGVDGNHPDLAANMVPGWNTYSNNSDTSDWDDHGTAIAGAAAGVGNNGTGIAGVAMNVKIMPMRINDPAIGVWGSYSEISEALNWSRNNGARVASISYCPIMSSTVSSAASAFRNAGGIVMTCAANNSVNEGIAENPALVVVSATEQNDVKTSWSSYGDFVDITAPGQNIYTTRRGGTYWWTYGTSLSTPLVAGLAALVLSVNPALSPNDVEEIIETSAVDLGEPGYDIYYGHGRIDAAAAVALAQTYVPTTNDTTAPNASIASPAANTTVAGTVVVDVTATDNVGVSKVDLFVNGAFYATDNAAPYSFAWDTVPHGYADVTLTAKAYDAAGNVGTSSGIFVKVRNIVDTTPPVVTISNPADGATLSGRSETISASATDNLGVSQMRLYIDGGLATTSLGGSLSYNWNLRKVSDGSHTITVEAEDASGNTGSTIISVIKGGSTDGGGGGKGGGKPK